jgi:hypothetical protein
MRRVRLAEAYALDYAHAERFGAGVDEYLVRLVTLRESTVEWSELA